MIVCYGSYTTLLVNASFCAGWVEAQPKGGASVSSLDTGEHLLVSFLRGCVLCHINHGILRKASHPFATIREVNGAPLRVSLCKPAQGNDYVKFTTSEGFTLKYNARGNNNLSVSNVVPIVMALDRKLKPGGDFEVNGATAAIANVVRMLYAWCVRTHQTALWDSDNAPAYGRPRARGMSESDPGSDSDINVVSTASMNESVDIAEPRRSKRPGAVAQVAALRQALNEADRSGHYSDMDE